MKFRDAKILLDKQVPLPLESYSVRRSSTMEEGEYGECSVVAPYKKIIIKNNKNVPEIAQIDSLIHEGAHGLLAGTSDFAEHGPLWGVCFAKCYCAVYQE